MHIIIIDMNHIYQKWHHFSGSWFHGFAMALGRPFRDVGTALVLRIELTAGHFVVPLVTLPPNVVLLSSQEKNQNMKKEEEGGNKAQQDTSLRLHPIDLKLCVYTYIHISVIIYCILSNSYILVCMYVYYIYTYIHTSSSANQICPKFGKKIVHFSSTFSSRVLSCKVPELATPATKSLPIGSNGRVGCCQREQQDLMPGVFWGVKIWPELQKGYTESLI